LEWGRFPQLLDNPLVRRVLRDVEVQDPPATMADHNKAIEDAESNRRDREEIQCRNGFPVIAKKGASTFGQFGVPRSSFHPA
jgi:hypothetical protein